MRLAPFNRFPLPASTYHSPKTITTGTQTLVGFGGVDVSPNLQLGIFQDFWAVRFSGVFDFGISLGPLAPRNNLAAFCQTQGCKAKEEPAVVFQQILQKGHLAPRFIIPSPDIRGHLLRFGIWTLKTYLKLQKSLYITNPNNALL